MEDTLKGRICTRPFKSAEFHLGGDVFVCCPKWLSKPIGNLEKNTIEEIWNSQFAQEIRESIIDGSYRYCNKEICPFIQSETLPKEDTVDANVLKHIRDGKVTLENLPEDIMLNYDLSCNLTCPSCRTDKISHVPESAAYKKSVTYTEVIHKNFLESLGSKRLRLNVTGSGDPFASQVYRQLLENLDGTTNPNLRIELQTNGLLLTPLTWKRLKKIHANIDAIYVSIDAATEETYVKVRRGGQWKLILENMRFLGKLRKSGELRHLQANMVVQKSNYREMPAFAKLFIGLGSDQIGLSLLTDWNTWTPDVFKEQQVWREDHPEYDQFLRILEDRTLTHHRIFIGNLSELRDKALARQGLDRDWRVKLSRRIFEIRRRRYFLPRKIQEMFIKLGIFR